MRVLRVLVVCYSEAERKEEAKKRLEKRLEKVLVVSTSLLSSERVEMLRSLPCAEMSGSPEA